MKARKVQMSPTSYFTMYNEMGIITRVVSCSTDKVCPPPLRPGESRLKGRGNSITQKVVGGKIVDKTSAEMEELKAGNPKLRFDKGDEE